MSAAVSVVVPYYRAQADLDRLAAAIEPVMGDQPLREMAARAFAE